MNNLTSVRISNWGAIILAATMHVAFADEYSTSSRLIVDAHVHTAGIGAGKSGCFISKELREGYKFKWYLRAFGVTEQELVEKGDGIVLHKLAASIEASEEIDKAVVLAMDGVIADDKTLDREKTQVYIPNEFVARETRKHKTLLFGASINPKRSDALERLHQVKSDGAVLVKWIPAIMDIDPADPSLKEFYQTMALLKLPLLTHVGQEKSFGAADDRLGDPERIKLALENGVTVIAGHIATTGKNEGEDNYERLVKLFSRYENLYTDISSLTQINKLGYLNRALADPLITQRMIYGSDWPLQFFPLVSPWYHLGRAPLRQLWRVSREKNKWDRDLRLKRAMGVPEAVFARSASILGLDGQSL